MDKYSVTQQLVGSPGTNHDYAAPPEEQPVLCQFADRIRIATERAFATACNLNDHADRLYGQIPPDEGCSTGTAIHSGRVGDVQGLLNKLDEALAAVQSAAQRNVGLA